MGNITSFSQNNDHGMDSIKKYFYNTFLKERHYSWEDYKNVGFQQYYIEQFTIARNHFSGKTLSAIRAGILLEAIENGYQSYLKNEMNEFKATNQYPEFSEKIKFALLKIGSLAKGKPAFNFNLKDSSGKKYSLSKYKGKVIYVDFWASWCEPCIKAMEKSRNNIALLKTKDVVFIYISLDRDIQSWKNAVNRLNIPGINLIDTLAFQSKVAADYFVITIPKTYIIDKNQQFATDKGMGAEDPLFVKTVTGLIE
jgi:thiol-disulfide isomerase/thioredoxin